MCSNATIKMIILINNRLFSRTYLNGIQFSNKRLHYDSTTIKIGIRTRLRSINYLILFYLDHFVLLLLTEWPTKVILPSHHLFSLAYFIPYFIFFKKAATLPRHKYYTYTGIIIVLIYTYISTK